MNISVMGFLELRVGNRIITPSAPKLRSLLALLALRGNRIVTTGTLMEELWGDNPPASALATLQTYIYQLRRVLTEYGNREDNDNGQQMILGTKPLGYVINLGKEELDWNLFQKFAEEGRTALERGDAEHASQLLGRALELSPSAPLADVEAGPVLSAHINQLTESKLQALELRIEADLHLGRYRELVAELKTLITEHPFHEDFHAKLMLSLERSGRRCEALEAYQRLRTILVDELGIEPSSKVRQLQGRLLAAGEETVRVPAARAGVSEIVPRPVTRPAQLPGDVEDFSGRASVVNDLCELAFSADRAPRLLSITGMAGIGKSALATHVAHLIREQCTEGQFHAELRGSTVHSADPFTVLGGFLRATGMSDAELPDNLDERSQLFRSWTADRSVLVVLDDAASAAQVRPLLPGGRRCTVLVTSCARLTGLDGAKIVELEPLEVESCVELLGSLIGGERVAREEDMAHSIVGLCGRLPLAIRIIGAKLAAAPCYPLRKIVLRLSDTRQLLPEVCTGEFDMADRLNRAHAQLSPGARQLLSCFAGDGSKVFPGVAAAIINIDTMVADLLIEELVNARFLCAVDVDGYGEAGYVMPELIRSFLLQSNEETVVVAHRERQLTLASDIV